jgi:hypothetical protein
MDNDYKDKLSEFANALVDLTKAMTAYESFRETDRDFDRLEQKVSDLTYSFQKLSWTRRQAKKTLAKRA